ncbi:MAG: rRNA pseudouridine synthase [Verrucomicrobia subdivision 3 bacterium]|nr:rRNA pseudouridine synthase [Limisphaerales bacterium]
MRLQKFLAEAGVASRRAAEKLIRDGHVEVNGATVQELGVKVDPGRDLVSVDGQPVKPRRKLYVALNKPKGFICTRSDPEKRRIITDLLPPEWRNLYPVGRLDHDSEGLIFLTNDGDFALRLTHPRYGTRKYYEATVEGRIEPSQLSRLTEGIVDEGERLRAARVRLVSSSNTRSVVEVELAEGRNREIRRMFKALGHEVTQLKRTQIGRIKLGELRTGKWRTLTEPEIKSLLPKL